jgi:hypothetical protein
VPALFQTFWFGKSLPRWTRACLQSFIDHGHAVDLYCYDWLDAPPGVRVLNARVILPRDRLFLYSKGPEAGSASGFSNLFRYKLLNDRGGWWVDADLLCRSAAVPDAETFFAAESPGFMGSAVLRLPKGNPLAAALANRAEAAGSGIRWGQTGPKLLTLLVKEMGYEALAAETVSAFPIHYSEHWKLVSATAREEVDRRVARSPFVHLWNEMFRHDPSLDLARPEPGSFMDMIYGQHRERERSGLAKRLGQVGSRFRFVLNIAG